MRDAGCCVSAGRWPGRRVRRPGCRLLPPAVRAPGRSAWLSPVVQPLCCTGRPGLVCRTGPVELVPSVPADRGLRLGADPHRPVRRPWARAARARRKHSANAQGPARAVAGGHCQRVTFGRVAAARGRLAGAGPGRCHQPGPASLAKRPGAGAHRCGGAAGGPSGSGRTGQQRARTALHALALRPQRRSRSLVAARRRWHRVDAAGGRPDGRSVRAPRTAARAGRLPDASRHPH